MKNEPSNQKNKLPLGLLLCSDLFFLSKVTGTAEALGGRLEVEGNAERVASRVQETGYRCLLLDLAMPGLKVAEVLAALPEENRPFSIAFGSHVDTARLEEARNAGCDLVLPRSQFSATLPDLLKQYLL